MLVLLQSSVARYLRYNVKLFGQLVVDKESLTHSSNGVLSQRSVTDPPAATNAARLLCGAGTDEAQLKFNDGGQVISGGELSSYVIVADEVEVLPQSSVAEKITV